MKSTNAANTNNITDERGSDQDDSGAHAGVVDLSSILWRLQHLHIFQVYAGNIQALCSKIQTMTFAECGSNALYYVYDVLVVLIKQRTLLIILFRLNGNES